MARKRRARLVLRLIRERKLADLIAPPTGAVLEAAASSPDGGLLVVFDNCASARIDRSLHLAAARWVARTIRRGYETSRTVYKVNGSTSVERKSTPMHDKSSSRLDDELSLTKPALGMPFRKRNTGFED